MMENLYLERLEAKFLIYVLLGLCMLAPNFLITLTILWQKALRYRKEYVVIGSLALADALQGSALLSAGLHRSYLLARGWDKEPASMRDCIEVYNNFVWVMIEPAATWMMAALSLDRLIAVMKPLKYRTLDVSYGLMMAAIIYAGSILLGSLGVTLTYLSPEHKNFTSLCLCSWSVPITFYKIYRSVTLSGALCSIIFYIVAYKMYKKSGNKTQPSSESRKLEKIHDKKLINVLVLISSTTFVLYILPSVIESLLLHKMDLSPENYIAAVVFLYSVSQVNPILNLLIYWRGLPPIRRGVTHTLWCKGQLPTNLMLVLKKPKQTNKVLVPNTHPVERC